jgi:hypothetical protein
MHLKHAIIGDTTYGKGRVNQYFRQTYAFHRLALHLWHLEIPHPLTGGMLSVCAPLPNELWSLFGVLALTDALPGLPAAGVGPHFSAATPGTLTGSASPISPVESPRDLV